MGGGGGGGGGAGGGGAGGGGRGGHSMAPHQQDYPQCFFQNLPQHGVMGHQGHGYPPASMPMTQVIFNIFTLRRLSV